MTINKNKIRPEDALEVPNRFAQKKEEEFSQSNLRLPVPTKLDFLFSYKGILVVKFLIEAILMKCTFKINQAEPLCYPED